MVCQFLLVTQYTQCGLPVSVSYPIVNQCGLPVSVSYPIVNQCGLPVSVSYPIVNQCGLPVSVSYPVYTNDYRVPPFGIGLKGATRGVTVSMSAFLACHQRYCAGSSLASRFGLETSGFSMWYFLKIVVRGFLRVLRFPPLIHPLIVQPIK